MSALFISNGHPRSLFDAALAHFLENTHSCTVTTRSPLPFQRYFFTLSYFGNTSGLLKRRLRRLCNKYQLNVRIVLQPFRIANHFSLKSVDSNALRWCVVYKYSCPRHSGIVYIGKTNRYLITHIKEYQISASTIWDHNVIWKCFCPLDFKILKSCNTTLLSLKLC